MLPFSPPGHATIDLEEERSSKSAPFFFECLAVESPNVLPKGGIQSSRLIRVTDCALNRGSLLNRYLLRA